MKVELEVLGIDKEGVNYSAIYNWSDNDSDEIIELNLQKFTDGYNVFLANIDKFKVSTLLIEVDGDLVFKDVVSTEKEYELSVINNGVNALLKLVNSFVTTNTVLVPLYTEA